MYITGLRYSIISILSLALYSINAFAADVTTANNPYADNEALTASKMNSLFNEVKTAVNSKQNPVTNLCNNPGEAIKTIGQDGSVTCETVTGGAGYTDIDAVNAMGPKATTNALNHDRYGDAEAVNAMGTKATGNSLNHDRYSDAEATGAMGVTANANPLNHDRYSDAEAVNAMGTKDVANALNHDRYTDNDAITAMGVQSSTNPLNHAPYTDQMAISAIMNSGVSAFAGDGSAGALNVGVNTLWTTDTTPPPDNLNFTDCNISSGVTLQVYSGTTIRCRGTFTNNGIIQVVAQNMGGASSNVSNPAAPPHRGDARRVPGQGALAPLNLVGFQGGVKGMREVAIRHNWTHFSYGGGGGAGQAGGNGGGIIRIYASGGITNNGQIVAAGTPGAANKASGGGAGGIVILASESSITHAASATIDVHGGDGSSGLNDGISSAYGSGGGGGGGMVIFIAPPPVSNVANSGSINLASGAAGILPATTGTSGYITLLAGSGGGACGGDGGAGGDITGANTMAAASAGQAGVLTTIYNYPSRFFP